MVDVDKMHCLCGGVLFRVDIMGERKGVSCWVGLLSRQCWLGANANQSHIHPRGYEGLKDTQQPYSTN